MGNAKIFGLLFAFFTISCLSCVRDPQNIPSGFTDDPIFGLSGSLDGQLLNLHAGESNWTVQASETVENQNTVYTSLFSLNGCTDGCKPSLAFRFYKADATVNPETDFLQTIRTGAKAYVLSHLERDSFSIALQTDPGLFMSGYSSWQNLNGAGFSEEPEYKDVLGYNEDLNVCFQSLALTGCQYNQCIYFKPSTMVPCIASIQANIEDARTVSMTVKPEMGTPPFTVQWFDKSVNRSVILYHQDTEVDFFVSVLLTDALGNKAQINQTIRLKDDVLDVCYFPISVSGNSLMDSSPFSFYDRAEIIYTDSDGVIWSSTAGIQPSGSKMNIKEVSYFGVSPNNQAAYKTTLDATVTLFDEEGHSKPFAIQDGVVALSHR